ncbi:MULTISPECIES: hypothetical protein [Roseinatronobacter]|uniref:Uncharacterized protein n=1 Tax=Roseinatronobacter domitianus TaxID=2940293 RepID=A0ABT0LXB6_9RHOB|nr:MULTISPECIES: hypothetical protein [Roseibaca]MCL1627251.1 hypothetical protein [Roseibaca domitiana]
MTALDRVLPGLLLVISGLLMGWGILGLLEYVVPVISIGLQNSQFPAGLQFAHFFAILLTGAVFLFGYLAKWPPTRHATITMYAVLATLCFVEVTDFGAFGGGTTGVLIMLVEFSTYIALSVYMLRSNAMQRRFGTANSSA